MAASDGLIPSNVIVIAAPLSAFFDRDRELCVVLNAAQSRLLRANESLG